MTTTRVVRKPVKYLTNKELLAEIAECKKSYCSFVEPQHAYYDAIVNNLEDITDELLESVCARRSKELTPKGGEIAVVVLHGLIFRVMTYEHIPLDPERKRKSRAANQTHSATTFPPFKHFLLQIDQDGNRTFVEVCRSHWQGGFNNGWFDANAGKMSERLGLMYYMLVDRYARKGNWRGYCERADAEALTQRGWLNQAEITEQDMVLSYHEGNTKWSTIRSIYRDDNYKGKMFRLKGRGIDAVVTPGHKFITTEGIKEVEFLTDRDKIILCGGPEQNESSQYSDAFVKLIGWVITEGTIEVTAVRKYTRVSIYQNEGKYAESIRACVGELGGASEYHRIRKLGGKTQICFHLKKELCNKITDVVGTDKSLPMDFILSLSTQQRKILINTMIDGDGWRCGHAIGYDQKNKQHMDSFVALCTLSGIRTSVRIEQMKAYDKSKTVSMNRCLLLSSKSNSRNVKSINFHGAKNNGSLYPNEPTVDYQGTVWCCETEYGSFLVRRNGYVYLTGNSYNDEMKSLALMQLAQVGLQFDESKSSNPFAYYTQTINNSFTRVYNVEKKNQNIRDDLLISMGAAPSYTRQIESELAQSGSIEPKIIPSRRGRKTAAQVHAQKEADKPINE